MVSSSRQFCQRPHRFPLPDHAKSSRFMHVSGSAFSFAHISQWQCNSWREKAAARCSTEVASNTHRNMARRRIVVAFDGTNYPVQGVFCFRPRCVTNTIMSVLFRCRCFSFQQRGVRATAEPQEWCAYRLDVITNLRISLMHALAPGLTCLSRFRFLDGLRNCWLKVVRTAVMPEGTFKLAYRQQCRERQVLHGASRDS